MLEWVAAGDGARLKMLVLHDDGTREYAYGPTQGLPDSRVDPGNAGSPLSSCRKATLAGKPPASRRNRQFLS